MIVRDWHRHAGGDDDVDCVEVDPKVCLSPTRDGFFVHFETDQHPEYRGIGHVTVGPNGWTQEGTLEGGDLTLRPSIAVRMPVDGREVELLHGYVTAGRWVPA